MVNNLCVNGTMVNADNYSSPVPWIGLYVAVANLVCFILIMCDVFAGILHKKSWLPCRFFSLNSVTLTLLSIATKIPVDLTTKMPSAQDQLSKLSGTVFICIAIAFIMPSLGSNGEFESYANVTALSIFVITVLVNIVIQMTTGVIFSFFVEHFIILGFLLLMLVRFWFFVTAENGFKVLYTYQSKDLMKEGENSMLQRLKICYIHAFNSNPQFVLCNHFLMVNATMISTISSVVVVQAVLRSLIFKDLKFCGGVSDYRWSMWLMVVVQALTSVVVTVAMVVRWRSSVTLAATIGGSVESTHPYLQFLHLFCLLNVPKWFEVSFRFLYYPLHIIEFVLVTFPAMVVQIIVDSILCTSEETNETSTMEFKDLLKARNVELLGEQVLTSAVEDMERWMKWNKNGCPGLLKLLSNVPLDESLVTALNEMNVQLSCLHMLLLVEIAKLSTPSSLNVSLTRVFDEVFEIIHFIDSKRNDVGSDKHTVRYMSANVFWKFGLPEEIIAKKKIQRIMDKMVPRVEIYESDSDVSGYVNYSGDNVGDGRVIVAIMCLIILRIFMDPLNFFPELVHSDADQIVDFISSGAYATKEELYNYIERVFVGMLHVFLPQLPDAIFKHIVESPIEEYEERVRFSLGLVCKLESLESYMRLSFPAGSNITSLIHTQLSASNTVGESEAAATTVAPVNEDVGHEIQAIGQTFSEV